MANHELLPADAVLLGTTEPGSRAQQECLRDRCLATDGEACRFSSQTLNDFLQTLPDLEGLAPPSKKRKRSAANSAASVPQHVSDGEQGSDFDGSSPVILLRFALHCK